MGKAGPRSEDKSNLHILGGPNDMDMTGAVMRAADPKAKGLDALAKQLAGLDWELPRILTCLPMTVCIPALRKAGTGIQSREAAVAE